MTIQVNNNVAGPALDAASIANALNNSSQTINATIIPHLDSSLNLLSFSGQLGEIGSANDAPILTKHNGVASQAAMIGPFGGINNQTTAVNSGSTTMPLVLANARIITYSAASFSVVMTATIGSGYFVGQPLRIESLVGSTIVTTSSGAYTIPYRGNVELRWNGTTWDLLTGSNTSSLGLGAFSHHPAGVASGAGASAFGVGSASGTKSTILGNNQSSAINYGEIAETVMDGTPSSTLITLVGTHKFALKCSTSSTSATELTFDGTSGSSSNRANLIYGTNQNLIMRVRLLGRNSTGAGIWSGVRDVYMYMNGSGFTTILSTQTPQTDYTVTVTAPTSVTFGITSLFYLTITVTPADSTAMTWWAYCEVLQVGPGT